ncbi:ABC transporter ATP-binding protein [Sulfuriflexus sp.]|uniref:ABC transporter ATP-binding protein n=1 Tax=Sulfuriflexus sp. TaxID=2015443 RepID=UPI0028CEAFC1|nr:ABC transporter ATP-binding protein [Sulfuriflexus sp.]MDT8405409.1 ABC transporter ATP-binding protein [Sulfuriflexus sp.]
MIPINVEQLSKVYRGKRWRKVQALNQVSLSVMPGEVFGFLGPNGAGKSTCIKILMGLVTPTEGRALLCNRLSHDVGSRRNVGYLPENPALYDFLSGREYLEFVARSFGMSGVERRAAIGQVLERLSLDSAAGRPIRGYSKGMVQRLGLAQTLLHDPDIYVLDEPMSGLDPQGRALVKDLIAELKQAGKTVFFSTHITADVEKVCDRLAIIVGGQIQIDCPVEEIMRQGVTGYRVLARGEGLDCLPGARICVAGGGEVEFQVETSALARQVAEITTSRGSVELVEPLRRDLEQFFLDIVQQASA